MEIKRVQGLSQSGITNVPPQYIQPPESRPTAQNPPDDPTHKPQTTIPTVDLFQFDPTRKQSVLTSIADACKHWGAFHVTNHGVPVELLHEIRNVGLGFFEGCSIEEKVKYSCDSNSAASEGYGSKMLVSGDGDGGALDWRDYFDHHTLPLQRRDPSRWPHFPSKYREIVVEYSDQMKVLAQKLLGLISETLGLPCSCIEDAVGEFYQNITISYYPPCPQPDLTLGLQSHSDFGAVTLLIQDDVGGLQVFKDSEWITVHPLSDAILVILSDQMEILTNGVYRSAIHRAITNSRRARLSVATFHDPAKSINISPLPELISKSSQPKYRPIKYGDYVSLWYTKGPEGKTNLDALIVDY